MVTVDRTSNQGATRGQTGVERGSPTKCHAVGVVIYRANRSKVGGTLAEKIDMKIPKFHPA